MTNEEKEGEINNRDKEDEKGRKEANNKPCVSYSLPWYILLASFSVAVHLCCLSGCSAISFSAFFLLPLVRPLPGLLLFSSSPLLRHYLFLRSTFNTTVYTHKPPSSSPSLCVNLNPFPRLFCLSFLLLFSFLSNLTLFLHPQRNLPKHLPSSKQFITRLRLQKRLNYQRLLLHRPRPELLRFLLRDNVLVFKLIKHV